MIETISQVLGRVPSGLFILTARRGDNESGILASWVMQAGFAPPMLSVAVRSGRLVEEWLRANSPFVVHLLPEHQKKLLKHFVRGFEPGEPAFEGLEVERSPRGVPVLSEALGYLECEPRGHVASGDHLIFLGEVVSAALLRDEPPAVHIRKNGMRY